MLYDTVDVKDKYLGKAHCLIHQQADFQFSISLRRDIYQFINTLKRLFPVQILEVSNFQNFTHTLLNCYLCFVQRETMKLLCSLSLYGSQLSAWYIGFQLTYFKVIFMQYCRLYLPEDYDGRCITLLPFRTHSAYVVA